MTSLRRIFSQDVSSEVLDYPGSLFPNSTGVRQVYKALPQALLDSYFSKPILASTNATTLPLVVYTGKLPETYVSFIDSCRHRKSLEQVRVLESGGGGAECWIGRLST
jgi:hypothetical protein